MTSVVLFNLWFIGDATARVEVRLLEPRETFRIDDTTTFVTNDSALTLFGEVVSDGGAMSLFFETPRGVPDLEHVEMPVRQMTFDLGATRSVSEIVLTPVIEDDGDGLRSYAPRLVTAFVSNDGRDFGAPISLFAPT
ncbi:MAG: hypothetical protein O3A46_12275, partial [Candidatus Poribacteria bacterium]|nr:hypothetical protein [Candidatus Poribacteria bacterium]